MRGQGVLRVVLVAVGLATAACAAPPPSKPAPADPAALVWREQVVDPGPFGAADLPLLLALPDRIVGFASGGIVPALDRPRTALVTSVDAASWELVDSPINDVAIEAVTLAGGAAWAFGQVAEAGIVVRQVWTSIDGLAWTQVDGATGLDFGRGEITEVAADGKRFLALAYHAIDAESTEAVLLASDDGRGWSRVDTPRPLGPAVRGVASGPAGFVVLSAPENQQGQSLGEAWLAEGPRAWSVHALPGPVAGANILDVTASSAGYVAGGVELARPDFDAATWWSADGRTWTLGRFLGGSGTGGAVDVIAQADGGWLAFGTRHDVPAAWVSRDALTWTALTDWPTGRGVLFARTAIRWNGRVVVAGQSATTSGTPLIVIRVGSPANAR